jgi:serine phosphatase RsbU (regulator of sigma subunit)
LTQEVDILNGSAWDFVEKDPEKSLKLSMEALALAERAAYIKGKAYALRTKSYCEMMKGEYTSAYRGFNDALSLMENLDDNVGCGYVASGLGATQYRMGDIEGSLRTLLKGLDYREQANDLPGKLSSMQNIGNVFLELKDYENALKYYSLAEEINKTVRNTSIDGMLANNMGIVYGLLGDREKSMRYMEKSAEVSEGSFQSNVLFNMGEHYLEIDELEKAEYYFTKCLTAAEESDYKRGEGVALLGLGQIEQKRKRLVEAESHLLRALELLTESKIRNSIISAHEQLYKLYEEKGNLANAILHLRKYHEIREERYNIESKSRIENIQALAQFETVRREAEIHRLKNVELKEANTRIEEKNKEILDSIAYARRLQSAILPTDKQVKEMLPDSFILYLPKDIVAGDFYWMEPCGDELFFAAADCTGHGVPGAMVSVVCHNALNRAVREFELRDPGIILDKAREIIMDTFAQSEHKVNDGMDVALCRLNLNTGALSFAGANNSLWIIRKGEAIIEELKAGKQPVGHSYDPKPFVSTECRLNKGDCIYLFTDGFADQFGGDAGKKYKTNKLRKLLLDISSEAMDRQQGLINKAFESWRGSLEQVDDVCVFGVRL